MNKTIKKACLLFASLFLLINTWAQKHTLSGYVKDAQNGETLIGVTVFIKNTTTGTTTNAYGFYSISLAPGDYLISTSYIGYQTVDKLVNLSKDIELNIDLEEQAQALEEVVVKGYGSRQNIESTKMSTVSLSSKTIGQIPVALGETDVIKVLTLLPGVKTNDGGGSISVRGGSRDQNMIMLDEATVYNANHLGNLLSVFNNDAIQNMEFYKGNIPAQYGGRLSSVIDIRMKDGNNKRFSGSGGIGTLASRLTLTGPIVKNKGSYMISGRRTYIDLITKMLNSINDTIPNIPYYFYDLNLKANYSINSKNKVYVSGYFGQDVFSLKDTVSNSNTNFSWGNYTATVRWNYLISNKVFTNLTLLASNYNYDYENEWKWGKEKKKIAFNWKSFLKDYSVKYDLGYYMNKNTSFKAGLMSTYHDIDLGKVNGRQDTLKYNFRMPNNYSLEHAAYLSCEQKLTPKLSVNYGLRYSLFQSLGKASVYKLDQDYSIVDTAFYKKNEIYNNYHNFEPRIAMTYVINDNSSIKAGYSRTSQYMHIVSNSSVSSLMDIWVGSGPNIKPEFANIYSIGLFKNLLDNKLEASVEVYYKNMENIITFKEFSQPQFNKYIDEDFRFGIGRSYGIEFFLRKSEGHFRGWVSYTFSKTENKIKGIQQKDWFLSSFDRPHDLSIVAMYDIAKRLSISANFTLKSGRPFTSPVLKYEYQDATVSYFNGLNNDRMPVYHRLDLSLTYKTKEKPGKRFRSEFVLGVFDVYNRTNPVGIYFQPDEDNQRISKAYKQNLYGIMPSLTWNFSF